MKNERVLLGHGSGGKLTYDLINSYFLPHLKNNILECLDDSAVFRFKDFLFAFTTDSYVIDPIFFPGGDIGKLAVCGTINDICMSGAEPLYLSCGFIIEEGFLLGDLEKIVISMKKVVEETGVKIIAGDTKVVAKKSADGLFINTSGVGILKKDYKISGSNAVAGDKIILSGYIGDHGIAVMSKRHGLSFDTRIESDCSPLNHIIKSILGKALKVNVLRDPTRGGLATVLNEIAKKSNVGIFINEDKIPIREEVLGICEIMGLDPLYIANEGKFVACVPQDDASEVLDVIRSCQYGENANIIGEITEEFKGRVIMKTIIGGERIVDMASGELLPRIC
jgi:hydrogenase expression/formation protein HypE